MQATKLALDQKTQEADGLKTQVTELTQKLEGANTELASAKEQRLPVDSVTQTLKEGDYIAGGQGVISLITPAPHPHAAQIFLNWFLSREGQSLFQEQSVKSGQRNANSRRTDIPKDVIAPEYRLKDDAVFWENGPNVDQETAEATKLLKGILAKRP